MAVEVLTTTGSGSWTVPAGVTSVQVECWGAGGSSHYVQGQYSPGSGGAYSRLNNLSVTPGTVLNYTIAATAVAPNDTTFPPVPGDTWFGSTSTVLAKSGRSNYSQGSASNNINSGQVSGGVGDIKYAGGGAGNEVSGYYYGGGGSATKNGAGGLGNNGGDNGGSAPGGGAGGAGGNGNANDKAGADNVEGGGGGGGFGPSPYNGMPGGNPGGGAGRSLAKAGSPGGRGQIRLTYAGGSTGGGSSPSTETRNLTSIVEATTAGNNLANLNTDDSTVGAHDNASGGRYIRLATQDPSGTLTGTQTITIKHRWYGSQNSSPVPNRIDVVEAGSSTVKATLNFNSTGTVIQTTTFTFDASVLTDKSGANLELLISLNTNLGSNGAALIYVSWLDSYTVGAAVTVRKRRFVYLP